ncbi:phytoene dehydrogenase-like oxidoreductase [Sphaerochaeta pleomorpha str. Grapes]|uniref:Phytoene dehydrogenase-like oxidoreductase n=1 Tax=Sphaerochaeta pleomorpha (strain ATCC BAA-1885 / DSM 22778 / Grapes) TaxID=158190 RepID=G8QVL1_SPHPG|nr:NAD(P)/FAD-dependent oxidoreductase [Sphaerochaeta pleomorpha]AEV28244.1 phytoene dehydrogenase-like oxidoreductase [Sphaerochaeta pleomorpha str. Grapes]
MRTNANKKKVIIIGAGVAGLTAGIYALKKGYLVELYEKNPIAGGECTGWDRKGYHIDNCIHWMIGSKAGTDLNAMYLETRALDPDHGIGLHRQEIMYKSTLNGEFLTLYEDLEKTRKEWIALSPVDEEQINLLFSDCELGKRTVIPAGVPPEQLGAISGISLLIKSLMTFKLFHRYKGISTQDLIDRFHHPLIKACISDFCTPESMGYSFPMCYGNFASGDGGIPEGGSRAMALRMLSRFESLGGVFKGNCPVVKIEVDGQNATGITTEDGQFFAADYIIPACDAAHTFSTLLDPSYMNSMFHDYFSKPESYPVYGMFQAAWAVDCEENLLPCEVMASASQIKTHSWQSERITFKTYFYEPSFAPKGKQIIQALWGMDGTAWDYWKELENDKTAYQAKKQELSCSIEQRIEELWPGYKEKLSLLDSWTPCTYRRYCNAYRGYNQACVITKKSAKIPYPSAYIKNLRNVVLAGQWLSPPGGIPGSCITGKYAAFRVDYLEHKMLFQAKKVFFRVILPTLVVLIATLVL